MPEYIFDIFSVTILHMTKAEPERSYYFYEGEASTGQKVRMLLINATTSTIIIRTEDDDAEEKR